MFILCYYGFLLPKLRSIVLLLNETKSMLLNEKTSIFILLFDNIMGHKALISTALMKHTL